MFLSPSRRVGVALSMNAPSQDYFRRLADHGFHVVAPDQRDYNLSR
jgi:pimeloyl-ACP methyl ester carboxylesterase